MYVYYYRTYEKAVSGGGGRGKKEDMCSGPLPAAACTFESGHLTLVSGAGEGEVVSKKVGKETGCLWSLEGSLSSLSR